MTLCFLYGILTESEGDKVMDKLKRTAEIAADWWAKHLGTPKQDNGTDNELGMILYALLSMQEAPKTDVAMEFKEDLTLSIIEKLKSFGECRLYVDYAPEGVLGEIACKHNISKWAFPCKSSMKITPEKVEVSDGYKHPYVTIYEGEESENE